MTICKIFSKVRSKIIIEVFHAYKNSVLVLIMISLFNMQTKIISSQFAKYLAKFDPN